jgi:eukaryotic-like serine/threonine-protein kinase
MALIELATDATTRPLRSPGRGRSRAGGHGALENEVAKQHRHREECGCGKIRAGTMPATTLGRYQIVERIGAGGMGEVYRAHDPLLTRDVAVKVLPPDTVADPLARTRLLREARTAAQLNHPHICTVHEVGEDAGRTYVAMELVAGHPLSERLAAGRLDPAGAAHYGLQIASALAHAHEKGIVHRDLKGANVMITPEGCAKVLDFGLARRWRGADPADTVTQLQTLTAVGAVVGTLAYMAPEQLRGQAADPRTDVWALGVVLYEMAAGRRPFHGETTFSLTSAILSEPAGPLPQTVPAGLRAVIERCLEKDPARRYRNGGEARVALESLESTPPLRAGSRRRTLALYVGLIVISLIVAAFGIDGWRRMASGSRFDSLAVLPFENRSGQRDDEYLAAGLHEGLIMDLARLSGFRRVVSRRSVLRFRSVETPAQEIARELGVDVLLTASVARTGGRIVVRAQLVDPRSDATLWGETYDREMQNTVALQNEIVSAIAERLGLTLTPVEQARLATRRPVNAEAHEAYLRGLFVAGSTPEGQSRRLEYFRLAIDRDPRYAPAHAGVASVWIARGHQGWVPPQEAFPLAQKAALTALELDEGSAEAHRALASYHTYFGWDWGVAEHHYRRVHELSPQEAEGLMLYSFFLAAMGRADEAIAQAAQCLEHDPLNAYCREYYGWQLVRLRRYEEGEEYYRNLAASGETPRYAHASLWRIHAARGRHHEAVQAAARFFSASGRPDVTDALLAGFTAEGYGMAMRRAAETLAQPPDGRYVLPMPVARLHAEAGDHETALDWIERGYAERDTLLVYLDVEDYWDPLRAHPRFQAMLRLMRLGSR